MKFRANGIKFGRPKKVCDMRHVATARRMKAAHGEGYRQVTSGSVALPFVGT